MRDVPASDALMACMGRFLYLGHRGCSLSRGIMAKSPKSTILTAAVPSSNMELTLTLYHKLSECFPAKYESLDKWLREVRGLSGCKFDSTL